MTAYLEDIIQCEGKDVTILKIVRGNDKWYCAYVRIDNLDKSIDYTCTDPYPTYHKGNVLGVDTDHGWNQDQTLEEKKKDAINQIEQIIKYFRNED